MFQKQLIYLGFIVGYVDDRFWQVTVEVGIKRNDVIKIVAFSLCTQHILKRNPEIITQSLTLSTITGVNLKVNTHRVLKKHGYYCLLSFKGVRTQM